MVIVYEDLIISDFRPYHLAIDAISASSAPQKVSKRVSRVVKV
jgi:hypothetical protein